MTDRIVSLYRLKRRELTHWGDYGDILTHGMTMHLARAGESLQLERTAPFVPPISVGTYVVVTDSFRLMLSHSGLTGFSFRPVVKAHIVWLPWESWDRSAQEPAEYPESGEPEDYILERPHEDRAANALGDLYELVVSPSALVERSESQSLSKQKVELVTQSWDGSDFFGAHGVMHTFVSERAKNWLESAAEEYVDFVEA